MKITDIIRGDDHLTNSFRQLQIFNFLKYKPNFSHTFHLFIMKKMKNYLKGIMYYQLKIINKIGFLKESLINYMLKNGLVLWK